MRVLCLIDSLGSGGAQRQLTFLARQLKAINVDVEVLTYYKNDFFKKALSDAQIPISTIKQTDRFTRLYTLRKNVRNQNFDVLLAFMDGPSLYAEIAALPKRKWGLVVSERLAIPGSTTGYGRLRRYMHGLADYITTNSHTNRLMIEKAFPRLSNKVVTIYNALDLNHFSPSKYPINAECNQLNFLVLASHQMKKNLLGLVEAVRRVLQASPHLDFTINWFGQIPSGESAISDIRSFEEAKQRIKIYGIQDYFNFNPPTPNVVDLYQHSSAVILPSFFEGLPNVVCEAMACGKPILMSNVCDAQSLVRDGENGFLFDPHNPDDICRSILYFAGLSTLERNLFGDSSRKRAEMLFNPDRFMARYRSVLEAAMRGEKKIIPHWYDVVPESAITTVEWEQ